MATKRVSILLIGAVFLTHSPVTFSQTPSPVPSPSSKTNSAKPSAPKKEARAASPGEELQKAIDSAGNDRAALVRNLEDYLNAYPQTQRRPQIYRALVEACLQLRDVPKATEYAERIVALTPEDMSITLLAIQLLERGGDEASLHRAVSYSSRVLDYVKGSSLEEKSPRVSPEEWDREKRRDQVSILVLRGRLETKLHETNAAVADFEASYTLLPNADAALKLGELAEMEKDYSRAAAQFARAFALADTPGSSVNRHEVRQKLGNVWRLAHAGSEAGLGDFILSVYDQVSNASLPKQRRNAGIKDPYGFTLRNASGEPYPFAVHKNKVTVVNFWATWCGPCRALEPAYERVAAQFSGVSEVAFLSADCDEDESLVPAYLDEMKPKTRIVFADGLESLFAVESFPTIIVLNREGKVSFRSEGIGDDQFEEDLAAAVKTALASPATASDR